jgi:hypothetical protein
MIDGVLYCNDGDWVESRSALVEHMDGTLEMIYWDQVLDFVPPPAQPAKPKSQANNPPLEALPVPSAARTAL